MVDHAISDYNRSLDLDPNNAETYNKRGLAWYQKDDLDRALNDFDKALKINPQNISAYTTLGVVWLEKGELDWACSDLEKACDLGSCDTLKTVQEKGYCY